MITFVVLFVVSAVAGLGLWGVVSDVRKRARALPDPRLGRLASSNAVHVLRASQRPLPLPAPHERFLAFPALDAERNRKK